MEEGCSSVNTSTKKNKQFSGHFMSDFAVLCSCLLQHPLYLSYFLFFSPYLLKLLAFLSPLFFTTTLLLLSLLPSILHDNFTFSNLLENLQLRLDGIGGQGEEESKELDGFEEFEVYKIVFGCSTFDPHGEFSSFGSSEENPVEFSREIDGGSCGAPKINPGEEKGERVLGVVISEEKESPVEISGEIEGKFCGIPITDQVEEELEEEKILGVLISDEWGFPAKDGHSVQGTPECEKLISGVGKAGEKSPQMADKECGEVLKVANWKPLELTPSSINGGNQTQQRRLMKTHSRRHAESVWGSNDGYSTSKKHDDGDDKFSCSSSPRSRQISPSLSNVGSMRKEKEWRRTLACKLFEERHNVGGGGGVGGGEGMDLLWEACEKTEENRGKQRSGLKKKKEKKIHVLDYGDSDEEEGDEEEEGDNGKLCCLQALKFSAVKMNFGMGKPGFLKISKAFKGIGGGWLSHHSHHHSSGGKKKGKNY